MSDFQFNLGRREIEPILYQLFARNVTNNTHLDASRNWSPTNPHHQYNLISGFQFKMRGEELCKSEKYRQYNSQIQRTNNNLQNSTQKTQDWAARTTLIFGGELRCSGRVSRVTLVTNSVISHEWGNDGMVTTNGTYRWSFVTKITVKTFTGHDCIYE